MAWTFRNDVVAQLWAMLQAFQTANPAMFHNVYRSRPKSFADRPFAFVGSRNEALAHTTGIHRRTVAPTIVVVYRPQDLSEEMADVRDDVVDAFLEYSSDRPHQVSGQTLVEPRSTEDVELEVDAAFYPATVISFVAVQQVGAQTGT